MSLNLCFWIPLLINGYIIGKYYRDNWIYSILKKIPRIIKILLFVVIVVLWYCCIANFTVVTPNNIIYHSPLHPLGITYEYSDVDKINVYYKNDSLYYIIEIDNHKITFNEPITNDDNRYEENQYIELEDFDKSLVELGISKKSSLTGLDTDMNQECYERIERIINNK